MVLLSLHLSLIHILLDQEMSSVRDEIMDAQNSSQMQSNLVKDILNNIENLYRVSSEREITKIQTEFLRVFHTKDLKQLERFHRQLDIIAEGYRAQAVYHNIGQDVYKRQDDAVLLDVRTPQEYQEGHIPESKNVPLQQLDNIASVAKNKDIPLFVYCYSGSRSRQATGILQRMGYSKVNNICLLYTSVERN